MPKVSICIPTYNQTRYLSRTLQSIFTQSFQDYEIIITDDTPSTLVGELIDGCRFSEKIRYYHNKLPLGSPENWNFCISKATGEFIKIMHHDDWFTNDNSLSVFVATLERNHDVAFAFSSSNVLFENGDNWIHSISKDDLMKVQRNPTLLFTGNKIGAPTAIIFRKDIKGKFDAEMKWLVDIDFYIFNLINFKRIVYISSPLVTTFGAEDRISNHCENNKNIELFEHFYLFEKIYYHYPKRSLVTLVRCFIHLFHLCEKYNVQRISEIRHSGYSNKIPILFQIYMRVRNSLNAFKALHMKNIFYKLDR